MSEKDQPTLNQKIAQLDQAAEWFYSDEFSLEEASDKYKTAIKLAKTIEDDLLKLKNEIEILSQDFSK